MSSPGTSILIISFSRPDDTKKDRAWVKPDQGRFFYKIVNSNQKPEIQLIETYPDLFNRFQVDDDSSIPGIVRSEAFLSVVEKAGYAKNGDEYTTFISSIGFFGEFLTYAYKNLDVDLYNTLYQINQYEKGKYEDEFKTNQNITPEFISKTGHTILPCFDDDHDGTEEYLKYLLCRELLVGGYEGVIASLLENKREITSDQFIDTLGLMVERGGVFRPFSQGFAGLVANHLKRLGTEDLLKQSEKLAKSPVSFVNHRLLSDLVLGEKKEDFVRRMRQEEFREVTRHGIVFMKYLGVCVDRPEDMYHNTNWEVLNILSEREGGNEQERSKDCEFLVSLVRCFGVGMRSGKDDRFQDGREGAIGNLVIERCSDGRMMRRVIESLGSDEIRYIRVYLKGTTGVLLKKCEGAHCFDWGWDLIKEEQLSEEMKCYIKGILLMIMKASIKEQSVQSTTSPGFVRELHFMTHLVELAYVNNGREHKTLSSAIKTVQESFEHLEFTLAQCRALGSKGGNINHNTHTEPSGERRQEEWYDKLVSQCKVYVDMLDLNTTLASLSGEGQSEAIENKKMAEIKEQMGQHRWGKLLQRWQNLERCRTKFFQMHFRARIAKKIPKTSEELFEAVDTVLTECNNIVASLESSGLKLLYFRQLKETVTHNDLKVFGISDRKYQLAVELSELYDGVTVLLEIAETNSERCHGMSPFRKIAGAKSSSLREIGKQFDSLGSTFTGLVEHLLFIGKIANYRSLRDFVQELDRKEGGDLRFLRNNRYTQKGSPVGYQELVGYAILTFRDLLGLTTLTFNGVEEFVSGIIKWCEMIKKTQRANHVISVSQNVEVLKGSYKLLRTGTRDWDETCIDIVMKEESWFKVYPDGSFKVEPSDEYKRRMGTLSCDMLRGIASRQQIIYGGNASKETKTNSANFNKCYNTMECISEIIRYNYETGFPVLCMHPLREHVICCKMKDIERLFGVVKDTKIWGENVMKLLDKGDCCNFLVFPELVWHFINTTNQSNPPGVEAEHSVGHGTMLCIHDLLCTNHCAIPQNTKVAVTDKGSMLDNVRFWMNIFKKTLNSFSKNITLPDVVQRTAKYTGGRITYHKTEVKHLTLFLQKLYVEHTPSFFNFFLCDNETTTSHIDTIIRCVTNSVSQSVSRRYVIVNPNFASKEAFSKFADFVKEVDPVTQAHIYVVVTEESGLFDLSEIIPPRQFKQSAELVMKNPGRQVLVVRSQYPGLGKTTQIIKQIKEKGEAHCPFGIYDTDTYRTAIKKLHSIIGKNKVGLHIKLHLSPKRLIHFIPFLCSIMLFGFVSSNNNVASIKNVSTLYIECGEGSYSLADTLRLPRDCLLECVFDEEKRREFEDQLNTLFTELEMKPGPDNNAKKSWIASKLTYSNWKEHEILCEKYDHAIKEIVFKYSKMIYGECSTHYTALEKRFRRHLLMSLQIGKIQSVPWFFGISPTAYMGIPFSPHGSCTYIGRMFNNVMSSIPTPNERLRLTHDSVLFKTGRILDMQLISGEGVLSPLQSSMLIFRDLCKTVSRQPSRFFKQVECARDPAVFEGLDDLFYEQLPSDNEKQVYQFKERAKDLLKRLVFTQDNALKMVLIHTRMVACLPVVLVGETGVGKTELMNVLCDLAGFSMTHEQIDAETELKDMKDIILSKSEEAENHGTPRYIFFDELNTNRHIQEVEDIIMTRQIDNTPISDRLGFVVAVNPFRQRGKSEMKEVRGLSSKMEAEEDNTFAYSVNPIPARFRSIALDFGDLGDVEYEQYSMCVLRDFGDFRERAMSLIKTTKQFHTKRDLTSSLRELDRVRQLTKLFQTIFSEHNNTQGIEYSYLLALYSTYAFPLTKTTRKHYCRFIDSKCTVDIESVYKNARDWFWQSLEIEGCEAVPNQSLKGNLFAIFISLMSNIPLLLVGKPGTSKSLAVEIFTEGKMNKMLGLELLPEVVQYQGCKRSTPMEIKVAFEHAKLVSAPARNEMKSKACTMMLFNEVGLAERNNEDALKTLHALLDRLMVTNQFHFIGTSNHMLDLAKTSRCLSFVCDEPSKEDLCETAELIFNNYDKNIINGSKKTLKNIVASCVKARVNATAEPHSNYSGLRSFYSLIRELAKLCSSEKKSLFELTDKELVDVISFTFSSILPFCLFLKQPTPTSHRSMQLHWITENIKSTDGRHILLKVDSIQQILDVIAHIHTTMRESRTIRFVGQDRLDKVTGLLDHGEGENPNVVFFVKADELYPTLYPLFNRSYKEYQGKRYVLISHQNVTNREFEVNPLFRAIVCMFPNDLASADQALVQRLELRDMTTGGDIWDDGNGNTDSPLARYDPAVDELNKIFEDFSGNNVEPFSSIFPMMGDNSNKLEIGNKFISSLMNVCVSSGEKGTMLFKQRIIGLASHCPKTVEKRIKRGKTLNGLLKELRGDNTPYTELVFVVFCEYWKGYVSSGYLENYVRNHCEKNGFISSCVNDARKGMPDFAGSDSKLCFFIPGTSTHIESDISQVVTQYFVNYGASVGGIVKAETKRLVILLGSAENKGKIKITPSQDVCYRVVSIEDKRK